MDEFTLFGTSHLLALAVFVAGIWPVARLGRAVSGTLGEVRTRRAFAVLIPCFQIPLQVYDLTPARFSLQTSLPLQLCDVAWIVAVVALWTGQPTLLALLHFWGLTLTTQAMLTPDLVSQFPDPRYIGFWGMHMLVVWSAVFVTWGLGYRPDWRAWRRSVVITLAWVGAVFTVNLVLATNYGFVNAKPEGGSVLDYLGPWPAYVGVEVALVAALWAAMTWAFERRRSPATVAPC